MMAFKLFILENTVTKKCPGCHLESSIFYGLGKTRDDAKKMFHSNPKSEYGRGFCPACICEGITEDYFLVKKEGLL